jgi:hypothetical protein
VSVITYFQIDLIFRPWALSHGLEVITEHKGETVRCVAISDKWGNSYHLWCSPDFESRGEKIIVGCSLINRSGKTHTFHRERKKYTFITKVTISEQRNTLDLALSRIDNWSEELNIL